MGRFANTDEIFETEKPFRESFNPEVLTNREEQLKEIASPLNSVVTDGISPKNIFVYGSHGTGKTTAVHSLLSELEQDADEVDVSTVTVQCRNADTSYQVAIKVVNELRERRGADQKLKNGHSSNFVIDALFDELDMVGGVVLLVLDEFDHFDQDDDNLLYMLSRAKSEGHVENSDPAIIGISNDYGALDDLNPETKDSLGEVEVTFPQYTSKELIEILEERAEKGFKTGVVKEGAIRKCAALSAKSDGSARKAIDLLYESGIVARDFDNSPKVTMDHVDEAEYRTEKKQLEDALRGMGTHKRLTLCVVIYLSLEDENVRMKTIYKKYKKWVKHHGKEPRSERRINERLTNLSRQGILVDELRNKSGVYQQYDLTYPKESYIDAFQSVNTSEIEDSIQTLQEALEDKQG